MQIEVELSPSLEPVARDGVRDIGPLPSSSTRGSGNCSTDHRTVLVLTHYVGLTMAETAEVIGVPLGTVQSRLNRAVGRCGLHSRPMSDVASSRRERSDDRPE